MNFVPEQPKASVKVPYFDDVTGKDGWQGQTTTKSIERLKSEVVMAMERLGGIVISFQRGKFQTDKIWREGFQIHYIITAETGVNPKGRIDVAALPVKDNYRVYSTLDKRKEQSLKMALYMLRMALDGTWFLQQLSLGYAPLMPWMLVDGEKTVTQLWQESPIMQNLLPPGETDFVEGEWK